MDRRAFFSSVGLASILVPYISHAQAARKVYRIGILGLGQTSRIVGPQPQGSDINAFMRGLRASATCTESSS